MYVCMYVCVFEKLSKKRRAGETEWGGRPKLGMSEPQYTSIPQNIQDTFHTHSKIFLFVFFWNRKCNQRDHVYLHILARLHTEDSEDYQ